MAQNGFVTHAEQLLARLRGDIEQLEKLLTKDDSIDTTDTTDATDVEEPAEMEDKGLLKDYLNLLKDLTDENVENSLAASIKKYQNLEQIQLTKSQLERYMTIDASNTKNEQGIIDSICGVLFAIGSFVKARCGEDSLRLENAVANQRFGCWGENILEWLQQVPANNLPPKRWIAQSGCKALRLFCNVYPIENEGVHYAAYQPGLGELDSADFISKVDELYQIDYPLEIQPNQPVPIVVSAPTRKHPSKNLGQFGAALLLIGAVIATAPLWVPVVAAAASISLPFWLPVAIGVLITVAGAAIVGKSMQKKAGGGAPAAGAVDPEAQPLIVAVSNASSASQSQQVTTSKASPKSEARLSEEEDVSLVGLPESAVSSTAPSIQEPILPVSFGSSSSSSSGLGTDYTAISIPPSSNTTSVESMTSTASVGDMADGDTASISNMASGLQAFGTFSTSSQKGQAAAQPISQEQLQKILEPLVQKMNGENRGKLIPTLSINIRPHNGLDNYSVITIQSAGATENAFANAFKAQYGEIVKKNGIVFDANSDQVKITCPTDMDLASLLTAKSSAAPSPSM